MNYKYRELEYAKKIYDEGFQTKYVPTELKLVALYMKTVLEYKPKDLREKIYEFCSNNIQGYNRVKYYKVINKAINFATNKKNKLVTIEKIDIYNYEYNYINNLLVCDSNGEIPSFDYDCKKVAFTLLCIIKINKQICKIKSGKDSKGLHFQGGKKKYNDLKKMAKINDKLRINEDIIHMLSECNIVTPLHGGLIRLNFVEELNSLSSENGDNVAFEVKNFDNAGWYFDYYNGVDKMKLCKHCEQPFKQTKHDILYCNEHKEYYIPIPPKIVKCIDCEKEFEVDAKDNETCRCDFHRKEHIRKLNRERKRKQREKENMSRSQLES